MQPLKTSHSDLPSALKGALAIPNGAQFFKVALQVNPFEYNRHSRSTKYTTEETYNEAIIKACLVHGIQVIGVTDHHRVDTAAGLIESAKNAGIRVLPGFEACSSDGVHFLCLFDEQTKINDLSRKLGDFGILDVEKPEQVGSLTAVKLLETCNKTWGAVCIAAHVCGDSGVLRTLSGQSCINVWTHKYLLACGIAGSVKDVPPGKIRILQNREKAYERQYPIAALNCSDVSCPEDFEKPSTSCWIKMTSPSIAGLKDAFRDPESRIRLASDEVPVEHSELVAISWEGGFLDGIGVHLSDNLNALIGGRGTGKSTIIESIRYVLDLEPLGEEAAGQHDACVRKVIGSGTTISLLVRTYTPARGEYLVERSVPGDPFVTNELGETLDIDPTDLLPGIDLYGQHEISEVARDRSILTELLSRYVVPDEENDTANEKIKLKLRETRETILGLMRDITDLDEKLEQLPILEETLRRYKELGLDKKLQDHTYLDIERGLIDEADELIETVNEGVEEFKEQLPLDTSSFADEAIAKLPAKKNLAQAKGAIGRLSEAVSKAFESIDAAVGEAETELEQIRATWEVRRDQVEENYNKILRDLHKKKVDGDEYRRVSKKIRELKAEKKERKDKQRELDRAVQKRADVVTAWEKHKNDRYCRLSKTAKKVSRQLKGIVKVGVVADGDRTALEAHIRKLRKRKQELINALNAAEDLKLQELVQTIREGPKELKERYGFTKMQASDIADVSEEYLLELEELTLVPTTEVYLNIAESGEAEIWKSLDDLSTGQKATAVLMMLLLNTTGPLIIDQPEDDLDNRFIARDIIQKIREEKRKRQYIFSTHNANIPVLGDAELIIGLEAMGDGADGQARIRDEHRGSIDVADIKKLVKDVLEGGERAFILRRERYGL